MLRFADLHSLDDPARWVFPVEGTKATAAWNCEWGVEEDAKLMVGVWKHGHGNWEAIAKDETLGLKDKFFLDDAKIKAADKEARKIPNSIHLVRRADYLTHLLREFDGNLNSYSRNPVPSRPPPPKTKSSHDRPSHDRPSEPSGGKPPKRKATPDYSSSDDESVYESMDEADCKEILRPVKRELKRLKMPSDHMSREEKVAHLKGCLSAIGQRIEFVLALFSAFLEIV